MKHSPLIFLCISVSVTLAAETAQPKSASIVESYGRLPLAFEANQGQTDLQVRFLSRGAGYSLFLTSTEAVLGLHECRPDKTHASSTAVPESQAPKSWTTRARGFGECKSAVLRVKLVGANANAEVIGQDELPGVSNYFIGSDPKKWRTNVRQFAKVRYESLYPGVDLVYYGHQRELEYDFVLQPGANPQAIRLEVEGAKRFVLEHGDLVLTSAAGAVHLRSPHVYQEANGVRQELRARYVIKKKNEVGFEVPRYDPRRILVIDPILAYTTYLGGSSRDDGNDIAVDSAGSAYIAGRTQSIDFPTVNTIESTLHGDSDAFVTKFNPDGSALIYSTYLGGSFSEGARGIAVDSAGNAYVTGYTDSFDFPTMNAIQPAFSGGEDVFVTKLNASGTGLIYSTYLGGSSAWQEGWAIAVDSRRNAYVSGDTASTDFPILNALQPHYGGGFMDTFVTKINAAGSRLIYSTYLGGSGVEIGRSIAADSASNAYVTGYTDSTDFPVVNAFQPTNHGGQDAFVTKINAVGSAFYSTYLGGSDNDQGGGIAADSLGNAYVTGFAGSPDFPTENSIQLNGSVFVTKFNPSGNALTYSTRFGGSFYNQGNGLAVDPAGNAYITGYTYSLDFPVVNAFQPTNHGNVDAFVTEINAQGNAFVYSSYLGGKNDERGAGIALDSRGSVYIVGNVTGALFPTTPVAYQQLYGGEDDAFVAKVAQQSFVSVSATTLSLGTQVIGTTSKSRTLTVTNQGPGTLTINKIFIGGVNQGDFAENDACGTSLAAGASCTISVTVTPRSKNRRQAGLGISDSDAASPQGVALTGVGTVVSLSMKKLTFGDQLVGTSSAPQNVTLKNVGSTPLSFSGITISGTNPGDFSQTNTCGPSIDHGANCTIMITFHPTAQGTRKAAVSIKDDGGGSPQQITLIGAGAQ